MTPTPSSPPRRGSMALAIKHATAAIHREAERGVRSTNLFSSADAYASYLGRLHGYYRGIEPRLVEIFERTRAFDYRPRTKADLAAADLASLGWSPARIEALPVCRRVPRIHGPAAAFGVAYVLEGKTLGARFLLAEAKAALDVDADDGATLFAGYRDRTGAMWNGFRGQLEAFVAARGQRATVLGAAHATFATFLAWIGGGV